MQRRLTIEEDDIAIAQVTLDYPSVGQKEVGLVLHVTKIDASTIRTNDVLGTRVRGRTIGDESTQLSKVEGSDVDRNGQVHGHGPGDTNLMNTQVGIGGNDRTGTEVDTLAHEVTTNTTLLALETLLNRLEGAAGTLSNLRHATNLVVHQGRHVVLQTLLELLHDDLRLSVRDGILQSNVGLDDVDELMGQIILRAHGATAHGNAGPNVDGRDGQDLNQEPLGSGPRDVQSKRLHVLLPHAAEDLHGLGSGKELLPIAATGNVVHLVRELRLNVQTNLGVLGLVAIAVIALLPRAQVLVHLIETTLTVEDTKSPLELKLILGHHDAAAVVADATERLENDVDEPLMIHRPGEVDMTKVSRIGLVVQVSHTRIVGTTVHRLAIDLRFVPSNTRRDLTAIDRQSLSNRVLTQLVRIDHSKLQLLHATQAG
mmetsp:Transcript_25875/g.74824  ORF Transcript_25875/g.74824 Transcript_25875/m.74824 type:complete len:428 (-) Transcript_25875:47-1330(-)